jgi:hypothetical protein
MRVLHSVIVPREITAWQFNFDFDKVLLSSWEGEVLELHRVPPNGMTVTKQTPSNRAQ